MKLKLFCTLSALTLLSSAVFADAEHHTSKADRHAPISVMGDHRHNRGEWMLSYRHMSMSMSGNLQGSDSISSDDIATGLPNRFAGMPGMPPTLRIVPKDMQVDMDMFGLMYAPSDRVTLMFMTHFVKKEMTLVTYQGGMGTNTLGEFTTESSGIGDTKISALIGLMDAPEHKWHIHLGANLPTGSIDERDTILTPMNARNDVRLPYAMQLGSGTYDFEPGITYLGYADTLSWGGQYRAVLRIGDNSEGYSLGDQHNLQGWVQYLFAPSISVSARLSAKSLGGIDGMDSQIMGPVQTADPDNYGGDFVDMGLGVNILGQRGMLRGQRVAFEYSFPLAQDVDGVQMEMDAMWVLGYQYAF